MDKALNILYGVQTGDILTLTVDGKSREVAVGGILEHRLFSGNYIVMSEKLIEEFFGVSVDTVLIKADGDIYNTVNELRARFADNNYYVVDVLSAYRWEMQSSDAVFDLIGTLAIVVALFIFAKGQKRAVKRRYVQARSFRRGACRVRIGGISGLCACVCNIGVAYRLPYTRAKAVRLIL